MTFMGFPTIATVATPGGKVEVVIEVQRIDCGEPTPFECPIPLNEYVGKKVTVTGRVVRVKC
jgi:hypothetical protein